MTSSITKTLFVGWVWVEATQEISLRFASQHKPKLIAEAARWLGSVAIPDEDYREFLVRRVQVWDGMRPLITTLNANKVVMMPVLLYGEDVVDLASSDPTAQD